MVHALSLSVTFAVVGEVVGGGDCSYVVWDLAGILCMVWFVATSSLLFVAFSVLPRKKEVGKTGGADFKGILRPLLPAKVRFF